MKRIQLFFIVMASLLSVEAALNEDLTLLKSQSLELNTTLAQRVLNSATLCAVMGEIKLQSAALAGSMQQVEASMVPGVAVDETTLQLLETLAAATGSLAHEALLLSTDLTLLQSTGEQLSIAEGIKAMLQLSSDIGTMADRIGTMADKILIMADNIGVMADRIILTQQIQSENLALTQSTLLQTQTNLLALVSVAESASYDLTMRTLISNGETLAARMAAVTLSPWSMADELRLVEQDVKAFRLELQAFETIINRDTATQTLYLSANSLTTLADLSLMLYSFQTALDGYRITVSAIEGITASPTLLNAMGSMLSLSAEIGKMADAILEMGDQILVMADNIGMEADNIVLVQQQQSGSVAFVQQSILAAQRLAVSIIAARL